MNRIQPLPPRPRTLIHPGRASGNRFQTEASMQGQHYLLRLEPGRSLYDAMIEPLARHRVQFASTTILGGWFETLDYCVAPPDPSGQAVIAYTRPIAAGAAHMVFGNATIGVDTARRPLVHCHAAICTADGVLRGGHILTERSIIGPQPISVLVTAFAGFELRQAYDEETNIPLLRPEKEHEDGK